MNERRVRRGDGAASGWPMHRCRLAVPARARSIDPEHVESLHLLGLLTAEQADPAGRDCTDLQGDGDRPGSGGPSQQPGEGVLSYGPQGRGVAGIPDRGQTYARIRRKSATIWQPPWSILACTTRLWRITGQRPNARQRWQKSGTTWPTCWPKPDQPAETETCYRTAVALKADFTNALGNYGRWLMTQGRWADAETRLSEALVLAPKQAGIWNNLGFVLQEMSRQEAEDCYRNAIAINPNPG